MGLLIFFLLACAIAIAIFYRPNSLKARVADLEAANRRLQRRLDEITPLVDHMARNQGIARSENTEGRTEDAVESDDDGEELEGELTEEPSEVTETDDADGQGDDEVEGEDDSEEDDEVGGEEIEPAATEDESLGDGSEPDDDVAETEPELPKAAAAMAGPADQLFADQTERAPSKPKADLETTIGTRWSVLLGGLTLALGLIFLVRHSIEAGLLGPSARITIGAIFSLSLLAAGEWLRRRDQKLDLPVFANADIPSILTAAGISGAFATLFAAHALYDFVGPGPTFVLLTLIGLAALVLSLLHGPHLAALGLVGAYATPALVTSDAPNFLALAIHTLVVTAAVLVLARWRQWLWLIWCAAFGSLMWTFIVALSGGDSAQSGIIMLVGLSVIFALALGKAGKVLEKPTDQSAELILVVFGGLMFGALTHLISNTGINVYWTALLVSVVFVGAAIRYSNLAVVASFAGPILILATALYQTIADYVPFRVEAGIPTLSMVASDTLGYLTHIATLVLPPVILALAGAWYRARELRTLAGWLAGFAAFTVFCVLVVAYLRIALFEKHDLLGGIGLACALLLTLLTEVFIRRQEQMETPAATALAVGAVACLSFGLGIVLGSGWLPLAFSLTVLGIAFIYSLRPLAILPSLGSAVSLLVIISIAYEFQQQILELSTVPIFNELLLFMGLPAIALIGAGEWVRRRAGELSATLPLTIGLAILGLFVMLEISHWINNGDFLNYRQTLAETGAHALAAIVLAMGFYWAEKRTGAIEYQWAYDVAGVVSILFVVIGSILIHNPLISDEPVGDGVVFNLLLSGYLLPGIGLVFAGELLRRSGQDTAAVPISVGLTAMGVYLALQIIHWINGGDFEAYSQTLAETGAHAIGAVLMALCLWWVSSKTGAKEYRNAFLVAVGVGALFVAVGSILIHNPLISGEPVGNGLVFNLLLSGYLLPGIALVIVGEILRRDGDHLAVVPVGTGLAAVGLYVALQIIHWINGGDFAQYEQSLAETSAHAIASLAMAAGMRWVARKTQASVYETAFMALGALSIAVNGLGLILIDNPLNNTHSVGDGVLFNLLFVGYLLTGLIAAAIAWMLRDHPQRWYARAYAWLAGLLLFFYCTLMLRKGFQGPVMPLYRGAGDTELWSYSALWLALGAGVLAAGMIHRSRTLRAASGIIIALTVAKVFLLDMSALTGALRAISFIGLGLSLIAIGRFYQRLLGLGASRGEKVEEQ